MSSKPLLFRIIISKDNASGLKGFTYSYSRICIIMCFCKHHYSSAYSHFHRHVLTFCFVLQEWSNVTLNAALRLPDKNEFIPTDFEIKGKLQEVLENIIIIQNALRVGSPFCLS